MGPADSAVEVLTDAHKACAVALENVKPYHGDEPMSVETPWAKRSSGFNRWSVHRPENPPYMREKQYEHASNL